MARITEHFTLDEFIFSDTAQRRGIDNTPSEEIKDNIHRTADGLEAIRYLLGHRPIRITSGYRCPKLNRAVGGSRSSAHMTGLAADFRCIGLPNYEAARLIEKSPIRFDQLILEYGWIHISFDPRMRGETLTKRSASSPYERGLQST